MKLIFFQWRDISYLKNSYSFIPIYDLDYYHAYGHGEGNSIN